MYQNRKFTQINSLGFLYAISMCLTITIFYVDKITTLFSHRYKGKKQNYKHEFPPDTYIHKKKATIHHYFR